MKKVRQYLAAALITTLTVGSMAIPSIAAPGSAGNVGASSGEPEYKTLEVKTSAGWVERDFFFANSVPVVIDEVSGKTVISWEGGEQEVTSDTYVFAGGEAGSDFGSGSVTMNGGKVDSINGGGFGLVDNGRKFSSSDGEGSADIGEVTIEMNGGSLRQIVGGGWGCSSVDTVDIVMNGGTAKGVIGGGIAYLEGLGDISTAENAQSSPCYVGDVTLTLVGEKISEYPGIEFNGQGILYGGGQGYSCTENVTMNITGDIDLSNSWVIAGGANGYTKNAVVNVMNGRINSFQSVNRGTMETAEIRVTGGTIKNLYAAGDSSDSGVTGSIESVRLNIVKGEVENLHTGSNGTAKVDLPAGNDVITARYGKNAKIGNLESAKKAFGSCLNLLPTDISLDKTTLSMAIGEKAELKASVTGGSASESEWKEVIWSSSNDEIVSVDGSGMLIAEATGTAVITAALAEDDSISATCTITVKKPDLKISRSSATVKVGNELELTAEASPSEATICWEIEDETILEDVTDFDEDEDVFVVKGIALGETLVTAYLEDNEDVKAVCKVTVKENKNLPLEEQVDLIISGLDGALSEGPGGEEPVPEKKTEIIDKAIQDVSKVITTASVGKMDDLDDVDNVFFQIDRLENVLCGHFALEGELDDSEASVTFSEVSGIAANVDISKAGGVLPVADEDRIVMTLKAADAKVPADAYEKVSGTPVALDITLLQLAAEGEGETVQPRFPVYIKIEAPDGIDLDKTVKVWNYHNGTAKALKTWVDKDTEEIGFLADQFSVFMIGNVKESSHDSNTGRRKSGGSSSGWHPQGSWIQDANGWKFKNYEGTWAAGCWKQLTYNGREDWYHFNTAGYMETGWFTDIDGNTYYLNPISDGTRGVMCTGWQQIDGVFYYFNPVSDGTRGALYKNRTTPDGYEVGADGARIIK